MCFVYLISLQECGGCVADDRPVLRLDKIFGHEASAGKLFAV